MSYFSLRASAIALASALVLSLSGCGIQETSAPSDSSFAQPAAISGIVHGGQQPVVDATVTLWAAGNTGYGSAATSLATATTDANGNFSFGPGSGNTYTCPSSVSTTASQLVYLTASGGQPTTGVTNSASALMLALGDCLTIQASNPTVVINEVTTIASITALQQFFTPSATGLGNIGTSSTNITGLRNAMATVKNLVNTNYGTAYSSTTASGTVAGYTTNPVVTITPEQTKINSMANILAACVNSAGSSSAACNTLFTDSSATAAKDTLQAAYYLATNPTSTVGGTSYISAIYGTINGYASFAPALTAAPNDWTIGVTYGSASTQTITGTSVYFLNSPEYLAIDSLGNVWVVNYSTSSATTLGNSVSELTAVGVPEAQVLTAVGTLVAPRNIVIDPSNDVFVGNYGASGVGTTVVEYNANSFATETFPLVSTGPDAMASDGAGNIYVADYGGSATTGDLELIPSGTASNTAATQIATGVSVGTYSSMAVDSYNDVWLSNNASTATTQFICTVKPCTATTTTAGGQTGSQSIAVDHSNNIWIGNYEAGMSEIAATNTTTINGASGSPFSGGGLTNPTRATFAGLGNQWITNYSSTGGTVTEMTPTGTAISPSTGFTHTFLGAEGIAIDGSGNVWVGNYKANAPSAYITEIVGAAGPVITPYSANLPVTPGQANTIGTRP